MNNFNPRFPCPPPSAPWRNGPQHPPTELDARPPGTSFLHFFCGNAPGPGAPPPGFGGSYYLHRIRQQNPVMVNLPRVRHYRSNNNNHGHHVQGPSMMGQPFQQFRSTGNSEPDGYMEALGLASQELYHNYYRLYLLNFHTFAGTFDNDGKSFFPLSLNDFLEKFNRRVSATTGESSTFSQSRSIGTILESFMNIHDPTWIPLQPDAFALSLNKLLHEAVIAHMNHIRQSDCMKYLAHRNAPGAGGGDGWKAPEGTRMLNPQRSSQLGSSCVSAAESPCGCCECLQKYLELDRFQAEIVRHNECLERLEQLRVAALTTQGIDFGEVYQAEPNVPAEQERIPEPLNVIHRPPPGFRDEFPSFTPPNWDWGQNEGPSHSDNLFSHLQLPPRIQPTEGSSNMPFSQTALNSRTQTIEEYHTYKHSSPLTSTPISQQSDGSSCRPFSPLTYSPIDQNNENRSNTHFSHSFGQFSQAVQCNMSFSQMTPTPIGQRTAEDRSFQNFPPISVAVQTSDDPWSRPNPTMTPSSRNGADNLSYRDARLGPVQRQLRRSVLLENLEDIPDPDFEIIPLRRRFVAGEPSESNAFRESAEKIVHPETRASSINIPFAGFDELETPVLVTEPQNIPESRPYPAKKTQEGLNISLSPISSGTCGSPEPTAALIHSDISEDEPISWEYLTDGTPKPKPQLKPDLEAKAKSVSPEPPVVETNVVVTETIVPTLPLGFIDIQDDKVEFPPLEHLFVNTRKVPNSGRLRALKSNRRGLKRLQLQSPRKQTSHVFRPCSYESPAPAAIPSLLDLVLDNPEVPKKPSPVESPSPIPKEKVIQVNNWNTFHPSSAGPPEQKEETQTKRIKKNPFVVITPAAVREDEFTKEVNRIHVYSLEPVKPRIVISRKQIEFKIEETAGSREIPDFSALDSLSESCSNDTTITDHETESPTSIAIPKDESGISSGGQTLSPATEAEEETPKLNNEVVLGSQPCELNRDLEGENEKSSEADRLPNEEKRTAVWMKNKGKGKPKTEKNQRKRARNRRPGTRGTKEDTPVQNSDTEAPVQEEQQTSTNAQNAQPHEQRSAPNCTAGVHVGLPGVGVTAGSGVEDSQSAIEPKNAQLLDRLVNPGKIALLDDNGKLRVKISPSDPGQKSCELYLHRHKGNKSCKPGNEPTTMFMETNLPISEKYASIFSSKFLPRIGTVLVSDGSSDFMPGELTLKSVMEFIRDLFGTSGSELTYAFNKVTEFRDVNFPSLELMFQELMKDIRKVDLNVEEITCNETMITFLIVMAAFVLDMAENTQKAPIPSIQSSKPKRNTTGEKIPKGKMAPQLKLDARLKEQQQKRLEEKLHKRFVISMEAGELMVRSIIVKRHLRPARHSSLMDLRSSASKKAPSKRRSLSASEATNSPPSKFPDFSSTVPGTLTKAISTSDLVFPSPADLMLAYGSVGPEQIRTIF